jgi:hypothetical protein
MQQVGLTAGTKVSQVATKDTVYEDCTILYSDAIGLTFEVQRTVSEGGTIETVVSQVLVPWQAVQHVVLMEVRT